MDLVLCRVTIHLPSGPGTPSPRPGHLLWADPTDEYIAACIAQGHLVVLDEQPVVEAEGEQPTEAESMTNGNRSG